MTEDLVIHIKYNIKPAIGIKNKNKHHPDFSISWSLLIVIAIDGITDNNTPTPIIIIKIKSKTDPLSKYLKIKKLKHSSIKTKKTVKDQNLNLVSLPLKSIYRLYPVITLLKKRKMKDFGFLHLHVNTK